MRHRLSLQVDSSPPPKLQNVQVFGKCSQKIIAIINIFLKIKQKTNLILTILQSLLVVVALFACVFAETQDQETAEQYFRTYGYYPSWYNAATYGYAGVRGYPYAGKKSVFHFNNQNSTKYLCFFNLLF